MQLFLFSCRWFGWPQSCARGLLPPTTSLYPSPLVRPGNILSEDISLAGKFSLSSTLSLSLSSLFSVPACQQTIPRQWGYHLFGEQDRSRDRRNTLASFMLGTALANLSTRRLTLFCTAEFQFSISKPWRPYISRTGLDATPLFILSVKLS